MQKHPYGRRPSLSRRAATVPHASAVNVIAMLVLLLGGCGNAGIRGSHPDAGSAGHGGTQSGGSSQGGTGGAESSGGRETGGIAATSGGSSAGGSTVTGGVAGSAGGTTTSTVARSGGQANGGTSESGGATATAGGGSGGAVGGMNTTGTGGNGGASSSGTRGGAGGNSSGSGGRSSGGTGGAGGTTPSGGSAGAGSGGSAGAGSGGSAGAGSGGSKPAGGTFAASGAIETALAPVITSFCAAARHCCSLAGISATSLSDCESQFVKRQTILGLVSMGEASINATAVAACQAAYDEAAGSCSAKAVRTACTDILVGKQGENAPCGKGGDPGVAGGVACNNTAGPTVCLWTAEDTTDPAVTGICHKVPHGKKGDPCAFTCESGTECSFEQLGGPSDTLTTLCFEDEGLFCSGETDPISCQPLVAQGGGCDSRPDACGSTSYCDSVTKTCKAASTAGASCLYSTCLRELSCGADKKCVEPFWELATDYGSCLGIAQLL